MSNVKSTTIVPIAFYCFFLGVYFLFSAGPFSHHGCAGQYYSDTSFDGDGDAVYFCCINDGICKLYREGKYNLGIRIV